MCGELHLKFPQGLWRLFGCIVTNVINALIFVCDQIKYPVRDYFQGGVSVNDEIVQYGKITSVAQIGKLIRQRRKEQKLTQGDISEISTLSIRFLSELERGKETAEVGKVISYLQQLGLDLYVLPRESELKIER